MALGGGKFTSPNKDFPGTYIKVISAARASANVGERGIVALPIALNWGVEGKVFTVTQEEFQKDSLKILGYDYTAVELMPFREIFKNAIRVHVYNLNTGGAKATSDLATAKYVGVRGNDLKYVVSINVDDETKYDVALYMGVSRVDSQTVASAADLVDNDYVVYNKEAELAETAGTSLTGGTNGDELTGASYQTALDKFEPYNFHALVCPSNEETIKDLFVAYTKRMRDEVGCTFKTVVYRELADFEGVISVENKAIDADELAAVYYVAGAEAGCAVNKSNTNKKYDGELEIDCDYTQLELKEALKAGKFMFHKVEDEVRILRDINTFVSITDEKGEDFSSNQVIRVIDECYSHDAAKFNTKYLGKVQNDATGRVAYWGDVVAHRKEMMKLRAIENYDTDSLIVEIGDNKKSVTQSEVLNIVCAMEELYITTTIA